MLTWGRFRRSAPELAAAGRKLFYHNGVGLAFLGTVRDDGAPRVHPVCPIFVEDGLFVLMLVSPKLADLVRDRRFALHSFPASPDEDSFYLTGQVRFPADRSLRRTVAAAFLAERALDAPPPGFARQTLVEFLVDSCAVTRAGNAVTWASSGLPAPAGAPSSDGPRTTPPAGTSAGSATRSCHR
jgi:hypothetical protein